RRFGLQRIIRIPGRGEMDMDFAKERPWGDAAAARKIEARKVAWRTVTSLWLVLSAAFVAGSVFVIYCQATYSPFWDQWDWLRRYLSPDETFRSLSFTPINGPVVFIRSLLYRLGVALFGGANVLHLS